MTTIISTPDTKTVHVNLKTNLNGKLDCDRFCHIQLARENGISETNADNTIFVFTTSDGSHLPVHAKIYDSCRQVLYDISSMFTWLSHNMDKDDFVLKVLREVKNTSLNTEMVTYFYQVVKE